MLDACLFILYTVPDLTFSETTFLNPRRDRSEDPGRSADKNKRRKKDKAVDTEAEISRYFASANTRVIDTANADEERVRSIGISRSSERYHKRCDAERFTFPERSPLPPVELPETPFLGFGSVGGSLISPVRRSKLTESPPQRPRPVQRNVSPVPSASYFTWSKTRSPSPHPRHRSDYGSIPPVPPKAPQAIEDLISNNSTGDRTAFGVPVSNGDSAVGDRAIYGSDSRAGRRADVMATPGGRVNNSPPAQDSHSLPIVNDLKEPRVQNNERLSDEKINPQQASKPAMLNRTEIHKMPTDPPLMKSNDPKFERPEDLVNATLKLFLEKYGANLKGPSVTTLSANETPKLSNAVSSENDERHPAHQSPTNADASGGEPEAVGSDPTRVRESNDSPRPSVRRTMHSETQSSGKPPRDSHSFNEITQAPLDMHNNTQQPQSPVRGVLQHPTGVQGADAQSAWNGYKSIYEQQSMFEEPKLKAYSYQIQHDPFEMGIMNGLQDITRDQLEDGYGFGFNNVYNGYGTRNPCDSSAYHIPFEEHSYQGQFRSEGMRSQHFAEAANHVRAMEGLDGRWLDGAHARPLEEHSPVVDYNLPARGRIDPYVKAHTHSQLSSHSTVTDLANRGYLPFQRSTTTDESPRTLYSRPLTQGSSHGSVQQLRGPPNQPDDASLSGFWKPHRLY